MKFNDVLRGHVFPDDTQVAEIWTKADFCLDTNVLLDVYRYTDKSRAAFLKLVGALKGRLFVPHRVATEFARNRVGVIRGHFGPQRIIKAKLQDAMTEIVKKHPRHYLMAELAELIEGAKRLVDDRFGVAEEKHAALVADDSILRDLIAVIGDEVGEPYPEVEALREYKRRKEGVIPPFCKIDDDKDELRRTGDVLIWLELMKQYEGKGKPLIFITDDGKENWWQDTGGGRRDPQAALVQEAFTKIQAGVLFYTSERFSETAPGRLGIVLSQALVEETKKIREEERLMRAASIPQIALDRNNADDEETCPRCGGKGTQYGFEGGDGDVACWFECPRCKIVEMR